MSEHHDAPGGIRLQKVMAAAGIGSRRACEKMIEEGRVSVNDEVVLEQGRRVDPEGRPTVGDLVADRVERLFHVGRLDADTEGLLLLTNDGELAHRLSHPSYEVPKTYLAEVLGPVARDVGKRLREGVQLEDGFVRVDSFKLVDSTSNRVLLEVVLHEGRKHIVRRALAEVGHPVQRLVRTAVGPVHLGPQKPGRIRALTRDELAGLFALVGM